MERILEPEIMDGEEQAKVYATADFAEENQGFVDQFLALYPDLQEGTVLDLGCGPADIPVRLLRSRPGLCVTAVDASGPMLHWAEEAVRQAGLEDRIKLICGRFQDVQLDGQADAVISNSLVHHVPNAFQFWYALKTLAKPGAPVLIMDLLRPETTEEAQALVDQYAADEPDQLRHDFYHSLLSAFTEDEIAAQMAEMNLSRLLIDVPDDRHWLVSGRVY
ncbi:MAG: class I SAM-dependent methyltransferase [Nitrospira sp.]|nr:class I SAM-dependent methyltransferase [Nitrospira sp.]